MNDREYRDLFYQHLFKWVFVVSLLMMAVSWYYKDDFPPPSEYDIKQLNPPVQSATTRVPFSISADKYQYTIIPKFDYELTGILVTYSEADGFTNLWHHKRWKDFINIRDLCVIWEPNVSSGVYKNIHFSSDSWTCWTSWKSAEASKRFQSTALSNNHLLTDNDSVKAALRNAEVGDMIYFKGVLSEYKNNMTGTVRGTSIRRDDDGNGACETVFLDEFKILKKANPELRRLFMVSKWLAILSFIGFLVMFCMSPFKPR
ncbi:hypothetical protein [Legionella israelensis]|uniref:hypothetical protein n=1 Tax=Legionella israelensis TaxID=454 RepID=UPI001C8F50D9|nr:hypothetical protein [Legionella israelensis]